MVKYKMFLINLSKKILLIDIFLRNFSKIKFKKIF